ncbi:MAG TPA: AAA domain-containing protein [Myxococcales bacterium]|nr:AAA domain-containing protein [Myxococcales bacterium]
MDLVQHLDRLGALLDRERAAENERYAQVPLAERLRRGLALGDVEAVEEGGLAGRSLVTYARPDGRELGGQELGAGATVRVLPRREAPPDDAPSGIVARRQRARIALAFDEPPPDWAINGRVVLELVPTSATWERLSGAVRRMRDAARWQPLIREETPRFEDRPRQGGELPLALNPEQRAALELCERALDLMLVHGPPGTGKTTVLVEAIRRAAARGEKVLAAAPSNLAVDNLAERLVAAGIDVVRVGHPARVLDAVIEHTLDEKTRSHPQAQIAAELVTQALRLRADARKRHRRRGPGRFSEARAQEREARQLLAEARELSARAELSVLERADVVLATLTGVESRALAGRRFDLAVIDEATQAVEPAAYLALLRAGRAVLAGDHLQLPPTVLAQDAQELSLSLFERLVRAQPGAVVTLAEQHRMNERIMRYPSDALYQGKLRAHPAVAGHAIDETPLQMIDTAGRGFEESAPEGSDSKLNEGEAELAAAQVRGLLRKLEPRDVAVISPYEAQVQKLRQFLHDLPELEVDTVDGFQGREKEAVVVSLVRSNPEGELGFLADIRRINVALTRARKKLIVIGDSATVARHPFYAGFVRYAESIGGWLSAWDVTG